MEPSDFNAWTDIRNALQDEAEDQTSPLDGRSPSSEDEREHTPPETPVPEVFEDVHINSQCDSCDSQESLSYCTRCQLTLCDPCWAANLPHKKKFISRRIPHEKTPLDLAERITGCLRPAKGEEELQRLHMEDLKSLWFGVVKNSNIGQNGSEQPSDHALFHDYKRYEQLICQYPPRQRRKLTPGLVSFMGTTGTGKSSLINLLITLLGKKDDISERPVVGSLNHAHSATSGDVHLYADPMSAGSTSPIFYADCEGLQGGESEPMSHKYGVKSVLKRMRNAIVNTAREIFWSSSEGGQLSRESIVSGLYSKLLYTFSDVIVFVLHNSRTVESVVELLLVWGSTSVSHSSNQPTLPHIVIALNMTPNSLAPAEEWEVANATQWLLSHMDESLHTNPKFKKYLDSWEHSSTTAFHVRTKQLLERYYSSVKVIRIPSLIDDVGRLNMMQQQVQRLYSAITTGCEKVRECRRRSRMLLTANQTMLYFQLAQSHFLSPNGLKTPFDFVKASFTVNPVCNDLSGHIVTLARMLIDKKRKSGVQLDEGVFRELSVMVASCIMLDSTRRSQFGNHEDMMRYYGHFCNNALSEILEQYWPCSVFGCVNSKAGHAAGHQNIHGNSITGKRKEHVGEDGENYESDLTLGTLWLVFTGDITRCLRSHLDYLQVARSVSDEDKNQLAFSLHLPIVRKFYQTNGGADQFRDHLTCLCCLTNMAEHVVRCGHIICTPCLRAIADERSDPLSIEFTQCPMHEGALPCQTILQKPIGAGVRVLALDGGGVRAIVQLVILGELEKRLGGSIPIRSFFDLIVGTSAGGIVAGATALTDWTATECIEKFVQLCQKAFVKSLTGHLSEIRVFRWSPFQFLRLWFPLFETEALEMTLKEIFGEQCLFGQPASNSREHRPKVAFTSTDLTALPIVVGNYNRNIGGTAIESDTEEYLFLRSRSPATELKAWEALRATTAAPTWFSSYTHKQLGRSFLDGAICYNNPTKVADAERRKIWPNSTLDVLLSIGTGFDFEGEELAGRDGSPQASSSDSSSVVSSNQSATPLSDLVSIVTNQLHNSLDGKKTWDKFVREQGISLQNKAHRVNVRLQSPVPQLHEADKLPLLEQRAREWCREPIGIFTLNTLERQLIATSFYFELERWEMIDDRSVRCIGSIRCRYSSVSSHQEMEHLGRYLRTHVNYVNANGHSCLPCFTYGEVGCTQRDHMPITEETVVSMINLQSFVVERESIQIELSSHDADFEIKLCLDDQKGSLISGFPSRIDRWDEQFS